jgi:hypothetical protein
MAENGMRSVGAMLSSDGAMARETSKDARAILLWSGTGTSTQG